MSDMLKDATARPWKVDAMNNVWSGGKVADVGGASHAPVYPDITQEQRAANARLIVTAVNSYEPMLAALEGLEGILATAESNASGNFEWEYVSGKINAARAAITQAKGETA
jgi:hypothetical protein